MTAFPAFSETDWQALTACLQPVKCQVGALMFSEGDASDGLYFLLSGKFAVEKKGELPGKMQTVALLSGGSVAGEGAMAGITRRRASLVCLEAGSVLFLSLAAYARLCQDNPRLCLTLSRYLLRISALRLGCCSDRLAVLL
ncbi:MAG: cyclic nucleotide-binding domain-containing protein [Desulfobulbaceae bacterium]|nr:cyclic nucleotide-binding domain-containing protein [Desulfobulbaceae bacterium]